MTLELDVDAPSSDCSCSFKRASRLTRLITLDCGRIWNVLTVVPSRGITAKLVPSSEKLKPATGWSFSATNSEITSDVPPSSKSGFRSRIVMRALELDTPVCDCSNTPASSSSIDSRSPGARLSCLPDAAGALLEKNICLNPPFLSLEPMSWVSPLAAATAIPPRAFMPLNSPPPTFNAALPISACVTLNEPIWNEFGRDKVLGAIAIVGDFPEGVDFLEA